jgi:hypothetical protein
VLAVPWQRRPFGMYTLTRRGVREQVGLFENTAPLCRAFAEARRS